ncbi:glycosyltransferase family 2 protein [Bowmanella denitrificans]|uniref:glycosyltransferase family 2 protein n=1 Tax=Bowmanella denitrificans TaxID=366582 RepID=UPI001558CD1C|nr:glycosyltransferase family 2 protein [Bowmanella denitrificans]
MNTKVKFDNGRDVTSDVPAKVKLVAVAKDEAAYLAEWVFFHLYMGFDAIDIYLNRTSDNSAEVLEAIQRRYPMVNFYYADWIDFCPFEVAGYIQYLVYAKAFAACRDEKQFDYLMFLDIDEFWMPDTLSYKVGNCITDNSGADCISFQWFNEKGKGKAFSNLSYDVTGWLAPLMKSLFRVNAEIKKLRLHVPELKDGRICLCDGTVYKATPTKKECLQEELHKLRKVMIVHRLFRSPKEYVSLLNRGRPTDTIPLKLNREGYNFAGNPAPEQRFHIDRHSFALYQAAYTQFLVDTQMEPLLETARRFVEQRYRATLRNMLKVPKAYFVSMMRVLRGVTLASVSKDIYLGIRTYFSANRCTSSKELIALAKQVESVDLRLALIVWRKALELRPNGPMIKARIAEYEAIKLKPGMKRADLTNKQI